MTEYKSLERMIETLLLLGNPFGKSMDELTQKFNVSKRTIERYISSFRKIGFEVETIKSDKTYYKIKKQNNYKGNISELLHFTEEEALILHNAINSVDNKNILKENLLRKLYALYKDKRIKDLNYDTQCSQNISKINTAIKEKKQIILKNYESANTGTIKDRNVEPIEFTKGYLNVWCYDLDDNTNKIFKTQRINKVRILKSFQKFESQHKPGITDIFNISTNEKILTKLELSLRAKNLLIEEYPLAQNYITKLNDNKYLLNTQIANYTGVGRFVMGLIDEIKILEPYELKKYIENKIENKIL